MDKKKLTAPCGLDCFNCEIHESNLTGQMAEFIHEKMGVPKEEIACKGCRQQEGKHFHLSAEGCATLNCAREKKVAFCCDCVDFPCSLLAPLADGAERYPHNMKLFNLCRIQKIGIDRWIEEEAADIRKKYFTGRLLSEKDRPINRQLDLSGLVALTTGPFQKPTVRVYERAGMMRSPPLAVGYPDRWGR